MVIVKCTVCNNNVQPYAVKLIDDKLYCNDCWKKYRKENGLIDIGCINPLAVVCSDREPKLIEELCHIGIYQPADIIQNALNIAVCYIGHEECLSRMKEENRIFELQDKIVEGKGIFCPICGSQLKTVKGSRTIVSVCSVHGVVFHGIIKKD